MGGLPGLDEKFAPGAQQPPGPVKGPEGFFGSAEISAGEIGVRVYEGRQPQAGGAQLAKGDAGPDQDVGFAFRETFQFGAHLFQGAAQHVPVEAGYFRGGQQPGDGLLGFLRPRAVVAENFSAALRAGFRFRLFFSAAPADQLLGPGGRL